MRGLVIYKLLYSTPFGIGSNSRAQPTAHIGLGYMAQPNQMKPSLVGLGHSPTKGPKHRDGIGNSVQSNSIESNKFTSLFSICSVQILNLILLIELILVSVFFEVCFPCGRISWLIHLSFVIPTFVIN